MRCADCNKFVPYDTEAEPEGDLEISEDGQLTGEVTRTLPCGECGTELKSGAFDVDQDLNEIITPVEGTEAEPGKVCAGHKHTWDWPNSEITLEPTERLNDKDRKGNQIKLRRFMTQMYGFQASGDVLCKDCGIKGEWAVGDEMSAGSFDEQV